MNNIAELGNQIEMILSENYDPLSHQKSRSVVNSIIAYEKHKNSSWHISQKNRIKVFILDNQILKTGKLGARVLVKGVTLDEISAGTGIDQKGTITARINDLRKEGYDFPRNGLEWGIIKR